MTFDQNSVPKDLRPINVARINVEEAARIPNPAARMSEGFYTNLSRNEITTPSSVPVYLVPATSDGKIVGLNSGNPSPVLVQTTSVPVRGTRMPMHVVTQVAAPSPSSISPSSSAQSPSFTVRAINNFTDQVVEDGSEDSLLGKKVKFLCSFRGKILPRPSDGMLRYVGGQTRIITVMRDVSFTELVQKMVDACGQHVVMKYQLPDEDLDALVSVSCTDDLENMMEEYEKLLERSMDGSIKLRVFLFSASELDSSGMMQLGDLHDSSQKYVDAVNGVMEVVGGGIARKESIASATSTQNSDLSVADAIDTCLIGQDITGPTSTTALSSRSDSIDISLKSGDANLANTSEFVVAYVENTPSHITSSPLVIAQTAVKVTTPSTPYLQGLMDAPQDTINNTEHQAVPSKLVYTNPAQAVTTPKPLLLQSQYHDNAAAVVPQQFVPAAHMTMASPSSNMTINPSMFPTMMQSQHLVTIPDQGYNAYQAKVPAGVAGYGWNQVVSMQDQTSLSVPYQQVKLLENVQLKDDCTMCQKQLPHAHSDTVVQKQSSTTAVPDINTIYHSLRSDDISRLHPINKVMPPSQVEGVGVSKNLEAQHEDWGIVAIPNVVQSHSDDATQNVVPPLTTTKVLSQEGAKDYLEIFSGTEKSRSLTEQTGKDDIFDQQSRVAEKDEFLDKTYSQHAPTLKENVTNEMVSPNDLETVFANTNVPSLASTNISGNTQESTSSSYSNQDPWSFLEESHLPPPMTSNVSKKDSFLDNPSSKEVDSIQAQILDPVIHTSIDDNLEQVLTSKVSSKFLKQELEATMEEVTTSNLQDSLNAADISASAAHDELELQSNIDVVIQAKLESMKVKPEKTNLAFPLSDGVDRLQIIKHNDLEELRELGSGTFGTVYHGKWRGTDVAIKRINNRCFAGKPSEQERMIDDFWNEAIKLAGLHHPNVVAFYGVVLDGPGGSVATVTEYMVNGSLRTALQKNVRILDKRKRLLISMDVAFGMEYLHSRNIVHFDLKSDNLLVNLRDPHRPICKVGDLGLSKVKCQTLISGGVRGTLPWMAPELLNGSSSLVSEKVDIFSFGIVMWELLTGEEPYVDLHYGAIIGGIVSNTLRPAVPDNCDLDWIRLMEKCWSAEPLERPSFTEITDELRSMAAKISQKGQTPTSNTRTNAKLV